MNLHHLLILSPIEDHIDDSLREVLYPLGESIVQVNREIEKFAKEIGDDEDRLHELSWLYEEKGPLVEDYLGLSFVACQVYIRRVVSQLQSLHEHERGRLTTTNGTPAEMKGFRFAGSAEVPFSDIEVLWEFANCYKHKDEWDDDLAKAHPHTAEVVRTVSGDTIDMYKASAYLGNPKDYADVLEFAGIFSLWRKGLIKAYQQELSAKRRPRAKGRESR